MELTIKEAVTVEAKRQKMTMDDLAARACIEKRTLFRRLSDPGQLRMTDLACLGKALGWNVNKIAALVAAQLERRKV